jgi:hypothetical protein
MRLRLARWWQKAQKVRARLRNQAQQRMQVLVPVLSLRGCLRELMKATPRGLRHRKPEVQALKQLATSCTGMRNNLLLSRTTPNTSTSPTPPFRQVLLHTIIRFLKLKHSASQACFLCFR